MDATQKLLRFGAFGLNLDTEELRKDGTLIKLAPQPFRLLAMLASHAGQVVTREEIQKQIWGDDTFVDFEHGMNQCINQIRSVLNDSADRPVYVETIPRRGYRFLAPVVSKMISVAPAVVESKSGIIDLPSVIPAAKPGPSGTSEVSLAAAPQTLATPPSRVAAAAAAPALETAPVHKVGRRTLLLRLALVAAVCIPVIVAGVYWSTRKVSALNEKDTIVLADFTNSTGDAVFDDTLKTALSFQLEQSPFLNVLSDQRAAGALRLMAHPADQQVTGEIARELCLRTNSKAVVAGSIAGMGSQYLIGLKAVDCNTGDLLAEAQERAAGKEAVLKALDATAVSLRGKLGESLSSVQKYATPLDEATTPSLEALKAYSLGRKTGYAKGHTAALPFFKRASELDPNFAMPYARMSVAYYVLGEPARAAESSRKAYELREKVSEHERFSIEGFYYMFVTGELEKAQQVYELWQQTYSRDFVPYGNLSFIYASLGNFEEALEEARQAIRLEPNNATNYVNLGLYYASLNRLDEAQAVYKQAEERKLEVESLLVNRYRLAFLIGDAAQMAQLAAAAQGKPGSEAVLLASQADTLGWYGKLNRARELTWRAMDSAEHNDAKEAAAKYQAAGALREVEVGNRKQALVDADAAMKLAPNRDVQAMAALALARAGDKAGAEKLAAALDNTFPLDTLVQRYWLPVIRAAVALEQKDPNRAVELLKAASAIELSQPSGSFAVFLCPAYLRGEAYLMLHDGSAAQAEFQKFIDHRGLVVNFPWGALARLGVARAYAEQGNTTQARAAYQDFLTLWKDADPGVPIYIQAKAEYANLQ